MIGSKTWQLILLLILSTVMVGSAFAQQTVRVTASALNVRLGPSTGYSKIGLVYQGQKYVSISQSGAWHRIDFDNRAAYVHGNYVTNDASPNLRTNVNSTLNVRTGPGTNYRDIGDARKNQRWVVIGSSGAWKKVNYRGGAYWMHGNYLVSDTPGTNPPPGSLPVSSAGLLQMPDSGTGYYGYFPRQYRWGTSEMVYGLINAANARHNVSSSLPDVGIGDISTSSGQLFPAGSGSSTCAGGVKRRHCSHTAGRHADIRPLAKGTYQGSLTIFDSRYSRYRTRAWINNYMMGQWGGNLNQVLFNDQTLINEIGIVRPANGHDNHMHIRLDP